MKTPKINFAAAALFMTLFVLGSCTKGSVVESIAPQVPESLSDQNDYGYEEVLSDLQFRAFVEATITRRELEGYTNHGSTDVDSGSGHILWAYSIGGYETLSIDKIGRVSLDFSIKTNPYTQTAEGELIIQSMNDKRSVMRYQITGSDKINEMTSAHGYSIRLTLLSAEGGFVQAARTGSATLSSDEVGSGGSLFAQVDVILNNE